MWRNFHTLRVSESFKKLWHEFLKSAGLEVNLLFYQYVSDVILQELITRQFTLSQVEEPTISPLIYEESNALRYVAGYVCNKIKKKVLASKLPYKGDLLLCLMDVCDEDDEVSNSADWIHAVGRGGLSC